MFCLVEHTDSAIAIITNMADKDETLDQSIQRVEERQEEQAGALANCTCQSREK